MNDAKQIIMNYTTPPGLDDLEDIAGEIMSALPEEILDFCENLAVQIEDFPDEVIAQDLDIDDSYDLLSLYKSGKEISPGVEKKTVSDDDVLFLYRRPILDMWCESGENLTLLLRQIIIEELGRYFDFSDEEISDMNRRHYQGMF
ncbi:MAG: metallopeptidase family protein [Alphaproteobacteria bacterium]|nr:metallopeptidase family protein [Alphaproteobacteria bacterium]